MHPNNVNGWLQSARFQVERNGSIDQARKILLRAEMQLPKEALVWNQLFRVELLNAAQLRKRLEVLGGKIEEDVESEKDLSMGAAAFKIAQLAKKKFPDSPALIYEMLHSAKSMKDPIETLVKKLVVLLMEYETADATVYQTKYMVKFTAGGVEAARKLYRENTEKFPSSLLLKYNYAVFLTENNVDGLDECIGRIKEALQNDSLIEKDLRRGVLVNFLRKKGSHKLAEAFQLKICSENATDDHERLLLADIQCDLDLTTAQETLDKVFKADSKKILESCVEIALRWAGEDESRLYWLSSKCAEGKCRFLKIKEEQNSKIVGKLAFQLSTTAPVSAEFMREGLRLLEETDLNKFTFAEKCCSMKNDAECWVEFLRLTKCEKLENLGIVMSKARANLSGPELEKLHQIWTQ